MLKNLILSAFFISLVTSAAAVVKYDMVGPVQYPSGYNCSPADLSVNGKSLIIPLENDKEESLYIGRRKRHDKAFEQFIKVTGLPNGIYQPSADKNLKNMVFVSGEGNKWDNNDLFIATGKKGKFKSVRKLDEVNSPDVGDAFPFLSSDGLELFFFRDSANCYYSSREKTDEKFSPPSPFLTVNNLLDSTRCTRGSCIWMNKKKTVLLVFNGKMIYKSERKKTKDGFTNFELFVERETFTDLNYVSGIRFTQDLSEFFVFHIPESYDPEIPVQNQILWFRKSSYQD